MRCVSYTRALSCYGDEVSITEQNERIARFAADRGWSIMQKYSDRKKDVEADSAFHKMRLDGIKRLFDVVVVDSMETAAKGVPYAEDVLLKTFYPAGIHFAVVQDDFFSAEKSPEEVKNYIVDHRQKSTAEVMKRAAHKRQREGYLTVHDEKYGYLLREDRKGFVIDEEAAPVIRQIFQRSIEGQSSSRIADELNRQGCESPQTHALRVGHKNRSGKPVPWRAETVSHVLSNTAYYGKWSKKVGGVQTELDIPAIISKETFDQSMQAMQGRRANPGYVHGGQSIFAKRIVDADTGERLLYHTHHEGDGIPRYHQHIFQMWDGEGNRAWISYADVLSAVTAAVRHERELAQDAQRFLASPAGASAKASMKAEIVEKIKACFEKQAQAAKEKIQFYEMRRVGKLPERSYRDKLEMAEEILRRMEEEITALTKRLGVIETAFSEQNPWILCYADAEIGAAITKEQVSAMVKRVEVKEYREVRLVCMEEEWKALLLQGGWKEKEAWPEKAES